MPRILPYARYFREIVLAGLPDTTTVTKVLLKKYDILNTILHTLFNTHSKEEFAKRLNVQLKESSRNRCQFAIYDISGA